MGRHDLSYRLLFSQPRMIMELIREFVAEKWVEALDFSTLERINASYVTEGLKRREGDLVWKLRRLDGRPVYIYILLEFQSSVDRYMAVRLMNYLSLLYQDLIARKELSPDGRLPLVIPIVLYNGEQGWTAPQDLASLIEEMDPELAHYLPQLRYRLIDEGSYSTEDLQRRDSVVALLFWLEKKRERAAIQWGIKGLVERLGGPRDLGLRRAFVTWLDRVLMPNRDTVLEVPEILDLEEFKDMLEKRVLEWNEELREEGREEGLQKGREEGLQTVRRMLLGQLKLRFGRLDEETKSRVLSADSDQILEWSERILTARDLADVFRA